MSGPSKLVGLLLLAACSRRAPLGEGLPPGAAKSLESCAASPAGEVRDHCAVVVSAHLNLTGSEWLTLCGQLGDNTSFDICIERAVWAENAPASFTACSRINHRRTQQSCLLGATNAVINGPVAPLVDICASTGDLEADCWVHVTAGRRYHWLDNGADAAAADVAEALSLRPALGRLIPFATEVGRAIALIPPGNGASACEAFDVGVPRESCHTNRNQRR